MRLQAPCILTEATHRVVCCGTHAGCRTGRPTSSAHFTASLEKVFALVPVLGLSGPPPLQALTVSSVADNDGMEDCQAPVPPVLALAAVPAQQLAAASAPLPCPAPVSSSTPELATNSCVGSSNQSPNQGGRCSCCPWDVPGTFRTALALYVPVRPQAYGSRSTANAVPPATLSPKSSRLATSTATCPFCRLQSRGISFCRYYGSTCSGVQTAIKMLQQTAADFSPPGLQSRSCSPSLGHEESAGSSTSSVMASQSTTLPPSSRRALLTPRSLTPS